jgi:hypothetical protein
MCWRKAATLPLCSDEKMMTYLFIVVPENKRHFMVPTNLSLTIHRQASPHGRRSL